MITSAPPRHNAPRMPSVSDLLDLIKVRGPASSMWSAERGAMRLGTTLHGQIQRRLENPEKRPPKKQSIEFAQFLMCMSDYADYDFPKKYVECEVRYGKFVAIIDAAAVERSRAAEEALHVAEWKRSRADIEILDGPPCQPPFSHLMCTPAVIWSMQLSLQSVILEMGHGKTVVGRHVFVFHHLRPSYVHIRAMDLRNDALNLMRYWSVLNPPTPRAYLTSAPSAPRRRKRKTKTGGAAKKRRRVR